MSIKGAYISVKEAMKAANIEDAVIFALDASWHRELDNKKEKVKFANFDFLIAKDGIKDVSVSYEDNEVKLVKEENNEEMQDLLDFVDMIKKYKFVDDEKLIEILDNDERIQKALKKAKHLRIYEASFLVFDEEFNKPVWRVLLKNWPLNSYFKREKPLSIEVVVDAIEGKIIKLQEFRD